MAFPQSDRPSLIPASAPVALPEIVSGVRIATLKRVWFATPEAARTQARSLLESTVSVKRDGASVSVRLADLTLAEIPEDLTSNEKQLADRLMAELVRVGASWGIESFQEAS